MAEVNAPFTSTEYLLDDHSRTLFPLDTTRIIISTGSDRVNQYLMEEVRPRDGKGGRQSFGPQQRCYVAKHGYHLRRTLKLDPIAEFFIYDLLNSNRKHFKKDLGKTRRQYGYYFESGRPAHAMTAYREFKEDLLAAGRKFKFGLRVDIATYFNSLYHHDVVHYFENNGWSQPDVVGLSRFLREINGDRSIDCLPQGLHPCKVLGSAFLHIVDRSARLRSDLVLRFLDDIHLFSDDENAITGDFLHIQQLLGDKGLSLNADKTKVLEGAQPELATKIDEIKLSLLHVRRELIEVSDELVETDVTEYDPLSPAQAEYLLSLLRDPGLEEADAELVLTLLSEHGEEILTRMSSVWPKYPALSKPVFNFVMREFSDPESISTLAGDFLRYAPNATEYQLFWLAKVLQARGKRDSTFGNHLVKVYEHPNATPIVKAKILELADNRFGLAEMREEILRQGQTGWPSWAAAIGCRVQTKASRNKNISNIGDISPLNRVIADIAKNLDQVEPEEPKELPF